MLPGAPSRLPASFPLRRALGLAHPGELLGAWVRMGRWPLHLRAGGCALLASADLAYLLRRCARVLVRDGDRPAVLEAERLIAWRTLQIVVGAPYLPDAARAAGLYPGLRVAQAESPCRSASTARSRRWRRARRPACPCRHAGSSTGTPVPVDSRQPGSLG